MLIYMHKKHVTRVHEVTKALLHSSSKDTTIFTAYKLIRDMSCIETLLLNIFHRTSGNEDVNSTEGSWMKEGFHVMTAHAENALLKADSTIVRAFTTIPCSRTCCQTGTRLAPCSAKPASVAAAEHHHHKARASQPLQHHALL